MGTIVGLLQMVKNKKILQKCREFLPVVEQQLAIEEGLYSMEFVGNMCVYAHACTQAGMEGRFVISDV
jgi:hypothetical protein